jgi:hypothetical protein
MKERRAVSVIMRSLEIRDEICKCTGQMVFRGFSRTPGVNPDQALFECPYCYRSMSVILREKAEELDGTPANFGKTWFQK